MSRYRTVLLWVVLIVLFVGFYQVFNRNPNGGPLPPPDPRFVTGFPFGVVGLFLVLFAFFLTRARKGMKMSIEGGMLMQQGRVSEALRHFEAARPYLQRNPTLPLNLGMAHLYLWQLAEAAANLTQARQNTLAGSVAALAVPKLALVRGLQGQVEAARGLLEELRKAGSAAAPEGLLAEAVLACRAGDWDQAARTLARPEFRSLGGMPRSLAEALHAWAAERLRGERHRVDAVGILGEAGLDRLRQAWPELADFIERAQSAGVA